MARLRLSAAARTDLADIDAYGSAQFGQDASDRYLRGFVAVFMLLRRHPEAGGAAPQLGRGVRSLTHRRHRVLYRLRGDTVIILRILHHAMKISQALRSN